MRIFAKYVESENNQYADHLSRDRVTEFKKLCKKNEKRIKDCATPVPDILWPMEKHWLQ